MTGAPGIDVSVPRIVVHAPAEPFRPLTSGGDDPLLQLIEQLRMPETNHWMVDLARALIEEGKRFAETESGRRWTVLLSQSSMVENGWLLWNHANVDLSLNNGGSVPESPSDMLEDILRRMMDGDMEHYVSVLGAMLAEEALAAGKAGQ